MAFMQHVATYGTFHQLDTRNAGIVSYPGEYLFPAEVAKMHPLVAAYIVTQMALAMGLMEAIEFTEWLGHRAEEAK